MILCIQINFTLLQSWSCPAFITPNLFTHIQISKWYTEFLHDVIWRVVGPRQKHEWNYPGVQLMFCCSHPHIFCNQTWVYFLFSFSFSLPLYLCLWPCLFACQTGLPVPQMFYWLHPRVFCNWSSYFSEHASFCCPRMVLSSANYVFWAKIVCKHKKYFWKI